MKLSYRSTQSYIVKDYDNVGQTQLPFITHYSSFGSSFKYFYSNFYVFVKNSYNFFTYNQWHHIYMSIIFKKI